LSTKRFSQILVTKLNIKELRKKRHPSILLATLLERCIEIWQIFLKSNQILAIENLKKHLILPLLIFNIAFWLYRASQKKATLKGRATES